MGIDSYIVKQKLETVRLWCRIKQMPESRQCPIVHKWSLNISTSWEKIMLSFIAENNLEDVMLVDKPDKAVCITIAKQKLIHTETVKWQAKLMTTGMTKTETNSEHILRIRRNLKQKIM